MLSTSTRGSRIISVGRGSKGRFCSPPRIRFTTCILKYICFPVPPEPLQTRAKPYLFLLDIITKRPMPTADAMNNSATTDPTAASTTAELLSGAGLTEINDKCLSKAATFLNKKRKI